MKIKSIIQTCHACPSQWEGKLENGKMFYVRYRWGYLSIRISKEKTKNVDKAIDGEEIYGKQLGDGYDGEIEEDKILKIIKDL